MKIFILYRIWYSTFSNEFFENNFNIIIIIVALRAGAVEVELSASSAQALAYLSHTRQVVSTALDHLQALLVVLDLRGI